MLKSAWYMRMCPDSKVHGANMGPIWGRQDPGGLHGGPINFAIWVCMLLICQYDDGWGRQVITYYDI